MDYRWGGNIHTESSPENVTKGNETERRVYDQTSVLSARLQPTVGTKQDQERSSILPSTWQPGHSAAHPATPELRILSNLLDLLHKSHINRWNGPERELQRPGTTECHVTGSLQQWHSASVTDSHWTVVVDWWSHRGLTEVSHRSHRSHRGITASCVSCSWWCWQCVQVCLSVSCLNVSSLHAAQQTSHCLVYKKFVFEWKPEATHCSPSSHVAFQMTEQVFVSKVFCRPD